MHQSKVDRTELPISGTSKKLGINFVSHPETGRANGMTEALKTSIDLARLRARPVESTVQNVEWGPPLI